MTKSRRSFILASLGTAAAALLSDDNRAANVDAKEASLLRDYLKNVFAYLRGDLIDGKEPDESLMRNIETRIDIEEQCADEFRNEIAVCYASARFSEKPFSLDDHPQLAEAVRQVLFYDSCHAIEELVDFLRLPAEI